VDGPDSQLFVLRVTSAVSRTCVGKFDRHLVELAIGSGQIC